MTIQDQVILALTAWRENRGGGVPGMQSVVNVVMNRVKARGTCAWTECTRLVQFSSMTVPGDKQLAVWPQNQDVAWQQALSLAQRAADGTLPDLTLGATLYYAPAAIESDVRISLAGGNSFPFPEDWNQQAVYFTALIADQLFFRER